ncbi:hypothetical protein M011DRAFT_248289 [Sporormia fimetaria CBS 119925]|uniref:Uncharacterized protein n=1 Tax=Sporormia fimetaria CBS 119925 TaxID=1340428 RepID=A0A6A6UY07_9PLEO|nr:hypothetical protein M011DRAFT_248289 [Sporormia fimetaria CBS 119925]
MDLSNEYYCRGKQFCRRVFTIGRRRWNTLAEVGRDGVGWYGRLTFLLFFLAHLLLHTVRVRRINLLRGITIMNSMAFRGGLSQPLEATLRSGKTIYRSRGYEHVIDQPMAKAEDQYRALSPLHIHTTYN